jgi:transposase
MMNALLAGKNLVELDPAKEKGLLRKRACCPQCGQELDAVGAGSVQARRRLELRGLDPFSVQVDLPKFRCKACSRECVPPEKAVVDGLMKASANAFRSASISPI